MEFADLSYVGRKGGGKWVFRHTAGEHRRRQTRIVRNFASLSDGGGPGGQELILAVFLQLVPVGLLIGKVMFRFLFMERAAEAGLVSLLVSGGQFCPACRADEAWWWLIQLER